jgi:hypothetical protein
MIEQGEEHEKLFNEKVIPVLPRFEQDKPVLAVWTFRLLMLLDFAELGRLSQQTRYQGIWPWTR